MKNTSPSNQDRERFAERTTRLLDEALLAYAHKNQDPDASLETFIRKHWEKLGQLDPSHVKSIRWFHLTHLLFRQDGLLNKFLDAPEFNALPQELKEHVLAIRSLPWQFSFFALEGRSGPDTLRIRDYLTSEERVLSGAGIPDPGSDDPWMLRFAVMAPMNPVWQTVGPIVEFPGFLPDDILHFASHLDATLREPRQIANHLNTDPFPYLLLQLGGNWPIQAPSALSLAQCIGEYRVKAFDSESLKDALPCNEVSGRWLIAQPQQDSTSRVSWAGYEKDTQTLRIHSNNRSEQDALLARLEASGFELEPIATRCISHALVHAADRIPGHQAKILVDPEEFLFPDSLPDGNEPFDEKDFGASVRSYFESETSSEAGPEPSVRYEAGSALDIINNSKLHDIHRLLKDKT